VIQQKQGYKKYLYGNFRIYSLYRITFVFHHIIVLKENATHDFFNLL